MLTRIRKQEIYNTSLPDSRRANAECWA